jgi:hypothetical protein
MDIKIKDRVKRLEIFRDSAWNDRTQKKGLKPDDVFTVAGFNDIGFIVLKEIEGTWDTSKMEVVEQEIDFKEWVKDRVRGY